MRIRTELWQRETGAAKAKRTKSRGARSAMKRRSTVGRAGVDWICRAGRDPGAWRPISSRALAGGDKQKSAPLSRRAFQNERINPRGA
jgi:hypothetical protein